MGLAATSRMEAFQSARASVAIMAVRAGPQRSAQMIQHDRQLGDGGGQRGRFRKLGVEQPGIEAEPHRGEPAGPGAELAGPHHLLERAAVTIVDLIARVPGSGVPDPPETAPARGVVGCQHLLDGVAQHQVGMAHDPRDGRTARGIGRVGLPGHEHRLAHRPHVLWALLVVVRYALHEDGLDDAVGGGHIVEQLWREIGASAPIP